MRTVLDVILLFVLVLWMGTLQGCAMTGVGDKYRNAGVVCGTHIGLGFTERIGAANLEKGVILDGGKVTCSPDGTLTIEAGAAPPKAAKEPKP